MREVRIGPAGWALGVVLVFLGTTEISGQCIGGAYLSSGTCTPCAVGTYSAGGECDGVRGVHEPVSRGSLHQQRNQRHRMLRGVSRGGGNRQFTATAPAAITYTGGSLSNVTGDPSSSYIQFTSTGTFTVASKTTARILVLAGGGGGGYWFGGGGGGGGLIYLNAQTLAAGTYTVSVGTGGARGATSVQRGENGAPTTVTLADTPLYSAVGGGGGGSCGDGSTQVEGATGGSSGGACAGNLLGTYVDSCCYATCLARGGGEGDICCSRPTRRKTRISCSRTPECGRTTGSGDVI